MADNILASNSRTRIFSRYGIDGEVSITILFFTLDYFQEKLKTKFFKKSKSPYFGAILGPFCPNLGKNEFYWEKGSCQFLNLPIFYHHAKNQKKINEQFLRKNPKLTDEQTDRQTCNGDFIRLSVDVGPIFQDCKSIKAINLSLQFFYRL